MVAGEMAVSMLPIISGTHAEIVELLDGRNFLTAPHLVSLTPCSKRVLQSSQVPNIVTLLIFYSIADGASLSRRPFLRYTFSFKSILLIGSYLLPLAQKSCGPCSMLFTD